MERKVLNNKSIHQEVQKNILQWCNLILLAGFICLGIISFISEQNQLFFITIVSFIVVGVSLLLLQRDRYLMSSFITVIMLTIASYGALLNRNETISPDLLYLYTSYQMLPIVLAGILAQRRLFTLTITGLSLFFLTIYIVSIQIPLLGYDHLVQIIGSYVCIVIAGFFSDKIFLLTGQIMNFMDNERAKFQIEKKQLDQIINVYLNNKAKGQNLNKSNTNNDSTTSLLQETIQEFLEYLYDIEKNLKEFMLRSDHTFRSSQNILTVFEKQKDNIRKHKEKMDELFENAQEIDFIAQNKKSQLTQLIDLSQEGGKQMQNSVQVVERVVEDSKNMLGMISLIMEVAERTNILALNAAVEASRAGKAGGGFAIVAKEIKSLSTETTYNAETISKTLRDNIKEIEDAVDIIRHVSYSFSAINENVVGFSTSINDIVHKVSRLNEENSRITLDTQNILSLMEETSGVLEKTILSIKQEHSKIKEIESLSSSLVSTVKNVHVNTNTIRDTSKKTEENLQSYLYSIREIEDIVDRISEEKKA